jgi:hypothetical protein
MDDDFCISIRSVLCSEYPDHRLSHRYPFIIHDHVILCCVTSGDENVLLNNPRTTLCVATSGAGM